MFLPLWPQEAEVFDVHFWIPDPSALSKKRADFGDQQGVRNCQREEEKEAFDLCSKQGESYVLFLFFLNENGIFLAFTTKDFSICKFKLFWHL